MPWNKRRGRVLCVTPHLHGRKFAELVGRRYDRGGRSHSGRGNTVKRLRSNGRVRRCGERLEPRALLASVAFGPPEIIDNLDADGPDRVVAADIDRDGDLDALVGSYRDHRVAWYENDGDGRFTQHVIAQDATEVRDLVAADLDGDGDLDVAVAAYGDDSIRWYENTDGQGTFDSAITLTSDADGVLALAAVDLDDDGDRRPGLRILVRRQESPGTKTWGKAFSGRNWC